MVIEKTINNNGMGAIGFLWAIFIVLKVMAIVDWSWFIVIFWPVAVWLGVVAIVLIISGLLMLALDNNIGFCK